MAFANTMSVRQSLRLSHSQVMRKRFKILKYFLHHMIDRLLSVSWHQILLSWIWGFAPLSALKRCTSPIDSKIWTDNPPSLGNVANEEASYYYSHPGSRIRAFHWLRNCWPWMTLNGVMAVILHYFTEFCTFGGQWGQRPMLSTTEM